MNKVNLETYKWNQIINALFDRGDEEDIELIKEIKYHLYKEQSITAFKQNLRRNGYTI